MILYEAFGDALSLRIGSRCTRNGGIDIPVQSYAPNFTVTDTVTLMGAGDIDVSCISIDFSRQCKSKVVVSCGNNDSSTCGYGGSKRLRWPLGGLRTIGLYINLCWGFSKLESDIVGAKERPGDCLRR